MLCSVALQPFLAGFSGKRNYSKSFSHLIWWKIVSADMLGEGEKLVPEDFFYIFIKSKNNL